MNAWIFGSFDCVQCVREKADAFFFISRLFVQMYTEDEKDKIIKMREKNVTWAVISLAVGKKEGALRQWYWKNRANFGREPKTKVSRNTNGRVGLQIKRIVDSELNSTLSSSLPPGTPCPSTTRFWMENDLKVIKLLKKPLISIKNIQKRMEFAQKHLSDVDQLACRTIWSDETTVRRMPKGQDIVYRVHSSVKKENLPVNAQIQQGGFSVMFWGCFSILGLGPLVALEGNQNQYTYKDLLENNLLKEIQIAKSHFDTDMVFMQDNAPCHKTKFVMDFLAEKGVSVLDWPPSSPDLNPIENLWAIIKRKRHKEFGVPGSKSELIEQIFTVWENLDVELCERLTRSVKNRLEEVPRLNGRPT